MHVRPVNIQLRLRTLLRIVAGRILDSSGYKVSSCGQRRLWSDCAEAQAELSLHWAHMRESTYSHVAALLLINKVRKTCQPIYRAWVKSLAVNQLHVVFVYICYQFITIYQFPLTVSIIPWNRAVDRRVFVMMYHIKPKGSYALTTLSILYKETFFCHFLYDFLFKKRRPDIRGKKNPREQILSF